MSNYIRTAVSFDQLSEDQQREVLERFREINVEDDFWYELAIEEFKEDLRGRGLSCNDVCFSFGYSQSDYASFDAKLVDYEAFLSGMELTEKEKRVATYMFGNDFLRISYNSRDFRNDVSLNFDATNPHADYVKGRFDVKTWFFNVDENCKQADAYTFCQELLNKIEGYAEDFGNDACHKLLKRLEAEYEYQTSDCAVHDMIIFNGFQFDFETGETL